MLLIACYICFLLPKYYNCQKMDMLAMAYSVVAIAKIASVLMLLFSIWLLNTQWLLMVNEFLMFQKIYREEFSEHDNLWLYMWKLLLTFSRFLLLFVQLFGPPSIFMCEQFEGPKGRFAPFYVLLSLSIVLMEILLTSVDYWMYYLLHLSNRVLGLMSEETEGLRQDLNWLPQRSGSHRNVYQQQLYAAWHKLWRRCLRLDRLIHFMLKISQWHILLNLFACYLTDITIIFNIIIYSTESDNFHLIRLMVCSLLGILFHSDIMCYFAIFGMNRSQWKNLLANMEELWFTLGDLNFNPSTDSYGIAMQRQMSFAIMAINRRQHRRQDRVRRLQIAGLFDINTRTAYRMSTDIAMNVVILWQIAYKYYY
ncbi:putative gustatory receptor 58c [Drosophila sulfurigaster albostrigata]|uniref:putative gustatory receptor 58c n=1 Tax=Drosophila sulfurigaster albostrigata TaxID=89887 RepID=UPI002D218935|nr:putative gustatory receptor 58c [Drosophila sulfurigaster albostrigata]